MLINIIKNKKAQLMALEIKLFATGFLVGLILGIVAIVALLLLGILPDFILGFFCNCG